MRVDVLASLSEGHEIDCFSEAGRADTERLPEGCDLHPASDLSRRHSKRPYDVVIYQQGNGPAHDFLYGLLPGDTGPAGAARPRPPSPPGRACSSSRTPCARTPLNRRARIGGPARNPPCGPTETRSPTPTRSPPHVSLPCGWPAPRACSRTPSRCFAYPSRPRAWSGFTTPSCAPPSKQRCRRRRSFRSRCPFPRCPLRMRGSRSYAPATASMRTTSSSAASVSSRPRSRSASVARALARLAASRPRLRLFLIGGAGSHSRLEDLLRDAGIQDRAIVTGRVSHDQLGPHLALPDVFVHLRYPTARETSSALLRLLAQGCPVIMSDLTQNADVPGRRRGQAGSDR